MSRWYRSAHAACRTGSVCRQLDFRVERGAVDQGSAPADGIYGHCADSDYADSQRDHVAAHCPWIHLSAQNQSYQKPGSVPHRTGLLYPMQPRVLMVTAEMAEFPFTRAESAKKGTK